MEAIAKAKYLRGSAQKARLVIDLIRGRNVAQALAILKYTNKRAAQGIEKCLRSAVANATFLAEQENVAIDPDDLWVKTCFVDMGPTKHRRRVRPAPQGRAYREQRHYCHITVTVSSEKPETKNGKAAKFEGKKATDKPKKVKEAKPAPVVEETEPMVTETTEETTEPILAETVEETTAPVVTETPSETVEAQETENQAEIAEAKDITSQTTAEMNETKPADDVQIDTNEQLERQ
jgi:large subunit ribosomal protein L22